MQSKKNNQKKLEETPGEEQVTNSLEEYSNIKKRLHELGGMDPSIQSWRGEESSGVILETPQTYCEDIAYVRSQKFSKSRTRSSPFSLPTWPIYTTTRKRWWIKTLLEIFIGGQCNISRDRSKPAIFSRKTEL